jgi:hypothetical protein
MAVNGLDNFQMFCESMYDVCQKLNRAGRNRLQQYAVELLDIEKYKRGYIEPKESVG